MDQDSSNDVTPLIKRESLWAIIVILLLVIGAQSVYIFSGAKITNKDEETENTPITPLPNQQDNNLLGTFDNSGKFPTQAPQNIPTLLPTGVDQQTQQQTGQQPKIVLNREYDFPLTSPNGQNVGTITLVVDKYGIQNNTSNPVNQKILTVEITMSNQTNKAFQLNTKDYLSLSVNSGQWKAPSLHNDPVELRPRGTVSSALGFPLNQSDSNLRLQVNIPGGEKDILELSI